MIGPLEVAGKKGSERDHDGDPRRFCAAMLGEPDEFPTGEQSDGSDRESDQPLRPEKHERDDQRGEDESGYDPFHSGMRIHCGAEEDDLPVLNRLFVVFFDKLSYNESGASKGVVK